MAKSIKHARETLAEHFRLLADDLEEEKHSDEWLDLYEETARLVNQLLDMEEEEDEE